MTKKKVPRPRTKMTAGFETAYYPPEWVYPDLGPQPEKEEDSGATPD